MVAHCWSPITPDGCRCPRGIHLDFALSLPGCKSLIAPGGDPHHVRHGSGSITRQSELASLSDGESRGRVIAPVSLLGEAAVKDMGAPCESADRQIDPTASDG
jgi:hypothetical protein